MPNDKEYKVISYQILKSAISVEANYEEAQVAVSKADFSNKLGISLKEIRETNYWIRIIIAIYDEKESKMPRKDGSSYNDLISFVKDRAGHDRRYAIDVIK